MDALAILLGTRNIGGRETFCFPPPEAALRVRDRLESAAYLLAIKASTCVCAAA